MPQPAPTALRAGRGRLGRLHRPRLAREGRAAPAARPVSRWSGVTSNPTIFQAAIGAGGFYDDQLAALAQQSLPTPAIFERLALYDIRWAAHELHTVYDASGGLDGYVSYEVPPDLAHDTDETVFQATRLFDLLAVPNVMIKIPATVEGLPAIRASIAAGVNVNVTLIFSIDRYREVVEAYLAGLEDRAARGADLRQVASVASFFVSRVDTLIDPQLEERVEEGGPDAALAEARLGTAAIDNAKLAYQAWLELFSRAALGGPGGQGRPSPALPVGLDLDQEPPLPRRALLRGADRPGHGQHHAAVQRRGVR